MGQPGKCFFRVIIMVPPRYSTVGWRQLVVNKTLTRPRWIGDPRKIQRLLRSSSMDWNPTKRMPKRYYLREMKRATWCFHVPICLGVTYIVKECKWHEDNAWKSCLGICEIEILHDTVVILLCQAAQILLGTLREQGPCHFLGTCNPAMMEVLSFQKSSVQHHSQNLCVCGLICRLNI